jgi:hypothetical protein
MPRANDAGASNGLLQRMQHFYKEEADKLRAREEALLSAGTSSSTSEGKPGNSGPLTTDTASFPRSPVPDVENPSSQVLPAGQVQFSTVPSTSGSTQETGPSPASPLTSSEASTATSELPTDQPSEPVPVAEQKAAGVEPENTVTMADQRAGVPDPAKAADDIIAAAREEYNNKNYDEALRLVDDAEALYPGIAEVAKQARMAIAAATTQ